MLNLLNFCFCVLSLIMSVVTIHVAFKGTLSPSPSPSLPHHMSVVTIHVFAFKGEDTVDEMAAYHIDFWSRIVIPALYFTGLGIVYSLELNDGYVNTRR